MFADSNFREFSGSIILVLRSSAIAEARTDIHYRWCFISCRYLDFTMKEVWPNFIRDPAEER